MIATLLRWYEHSSRLQLRIAAIVFALQLVHLVWLTTDVVLPRLFGALPLLSAHWAQLALVCVDYLEIPTLIMVSVAYINAFHLHHRAHDLFYFALLNSQWIHILWITDEFVANIFSTPSVLSAVALAWIAILIDYLELPVIYETIRRAMR
jgi:hypothetical protein